MKERYVTIEVYGPPRSSVTDLVPLGALDTIAIFKHRVLFGLFPYMPTCIHLLRAVMCDVCMCVLCRLLVFYEDLE